MHISCPECSMANWKGLDLKFLNRKEARYRIDVPIDTYKSKVMKTEMHNLFQVLHALPAIPGSSTL